jgi:hypothetical protein
MFQAVTPDELWEQYLRFRTLAREVAHVAASPDRIEGIWEVVSLRVRLQDGREMDMSPSNCHPLREEVVGGSRVRFVRARWHGEVQVVSETKVPRDRCLHHALLKLKYEVVAERKVWHVLRLYHRAFMYAFDSSAIAEHVGSVIRYIEKRHACGRPLEIAHLTRAVKLRALGIRGDLSDMGAIKRALARCFPSGTPRFQVISARTWQSRVGSLGPSLGISRIRSRIVERRNAVYRFSWLMQELYCPRLCKPLPSTPSGVSIDVPPGADLAEGVWASVEHHVERLKCGAIAGERMPQFR